VVFCEQKQLEEHEAYISAQRVVRQFFHLVKPEDLDQTANWDYKKITCSRSFHPMAFISPRDFVLLKMQELTYFYSKCMDDNF